MKNKLMRTTALVGSLMLVGSVASAQTVVSGNLDLSFKAVSNKKSPIDSYNGFGKESQINVQNKGTLNNGLTYAAGFSLEFDGDDNGQAGTAATGWSLENTFIDLTAGSTTLTIGLDHMQNPDSHAHVNMVGVGYIGVQGAAGAINSKGKTASSIYPTNSLSQYQSYGIGVTQKTGIGSFSLNYVPTSVWSSFQVNGTSEVVTATSNIGIGGADIGNTSSVASYEGTGESQWEVGFTGDLGVKGLNVLAFYNKSDAINAYNTSPTGSGGKSYTGKTVGASYNFGQFTVGADWRKQEASYSSSTSQTNTGKSVGVAYAVNPQWSVGAVYAKADMGGDSLLASANQDTEKTKIISVGYNMGPVVVNAQARETVAVGGNATTNGNAKDGIIKISTKF
jgi:Gram-negative porin